MPILGQIWSKTGIFGQFGPGHADLFSALLVGRLVVVARGLYLARHLFTLCLMFVLCLMTKTMFDVCLVFDDEDNGCQLVGGEKSERLSKC